MIDSERQLAGKMVDEEVMGVLEQTGYMTPQHMMLIDTVLTMPGMTVEKEYQRRIAAINAVIVFCDIEEGSPSRRPNLSPKCGATDALPAMPAAKRQACSLPGESESALRQAIASVCITAPNERPKICCLCLGNPRPPENKRMKVYGTPGSLSRRFIDWHIKRYPKEMRVKCDICDKDFEHKANLMNHAETVTTWDRLSRRPHSVPSRVPKGIRII